MPHEATQVSLTHMIQRNRAPVCQWCVLSLMGEGTYSPGGHPCLNSCLNWPTPCISHFKVRQDIETSLSSAELHCVQTIWVSLALCIWWDEFGHPFHAHIHTFHVEQLSWNNHMHLGAVWATFFHMSLAAAVWSGQQLPPKRGMAAVTNDF